MRAWVSGAMPGLENLIADKMPRPNPDQRHLLVRVSHAALNYSDLLMINDLYQVRPARPFIPGQEIAGVVEAAPQSCGFLAGDSIVSKVLWGGFAEYALVRTDMAIKVPSGFGPAKATALPVSYVTALVALDHCAHVRPSDVVLIHAAAGGVGLASVEVATARGATVIATAGSAERLQIALDRGAKHAINYRDTNWVDQVKALTQNRGANVIVDPVGGEIGENSLRCIAQDGKLLIVGFASGKMPKLAPHRLLLKRASAMGVYWNHDTDAELLEDVQKKLAQLIADGRINPLIDDRYNFAELPAALDDLANRRVAGKLVLQMSTDERAWNE